MEVIQQLENSLDLPVRTNVLLNEIAPIHQKSKV